MNVTCQITDGSSLAAALEALPRAVSHGVARSALKDASSPVLTAVRAGIRSETGLLLSGTNIRNARGDRAGRVAVLISSVASREKMAAMKPRLHVAAGRGEDRYRIYYGRFVEFGHRIGRGPDADKLVGQRPFMRPGFDASAEAAATAMEEALGEGIDRAFAQNAP